MPVAVSYAVKKVTQNLLSLSAESPSRLAFFKSELNLLGNGKSSFGVVRHAFTRYGLGLLHLVLIVTSYI